MVVSGEIVGANVETLVGDGSAVFVDTVVSGADVVCLGRDGFPVGICADDTTGSGRGMFWQAERSTRSTERNNVFVRMVIGIADYENGG